MDEPQLTVLVITHNQARQIRECLESVAWAQEIVVVDAFSTDGTYEIAREFTPRVIQNEWPGFSAQRQLALSHATGRWILAVDSDEQVTPELRAEIESLLAQDGCGLTGFYVARKSFFLGKWIRHAGWYPGYQLRLCRRERTHVTERSVHEGYEVDGPAGYLREPMLHFTQPTLSEAYGRMNLYTSLEARDRVPRGQVHGRHFLFHPVAAFARKFIAQKGFLDGMHGFLLSALTATYKMLLYMKTWELQQQGSMNGVKLNAAGD